MPSWRWMLGGAASAAALLVAPAGASALTATLDQPCYSHIPTRGSQPLVVSVTGGTPNAGFLVSATDPGHGIGSAGSAEGTFDASGNGTATIQDVAPPSGTIEPTRGQTVELSVQDFGAGAAEVPIGTALVTTLTMDVSSRPLSPRSRRLVRVSGTPFAHRPLYGFIVQGTHSRVLRRFFIGRGDVCGFASTKAVVAPPHMKPGNYRLYINAGGKLDKSHALFQSFRIYRRVF